jgi:hypothetical protein
MRPEELTPAYFTSILGYPVERVEQTRIGDGLVGLNLRCHLTGIDGSTSSVVAKLPSPDDTSRATALALGNYFREVRFYQELAATVAIRTPACYDAEWHASTGDFVVVLEDMAPAVQGDQVAGCSVAEAALALVELAKLHASRWDDQSLYDIEWLQRRTAESAPMLQAMYQSLWPGFVQRLGHHLTPSQRELGERLGSSMVAWVERRQPPNAVTHGDYRLDNLLFGDDGVRPPVTVVDWQTPGHGPPVADASYFIGAGPVIADRRAHERALLESYHRELVARGVTDFRFDDCWEQYRLFAFSGCVMTVVASMIVGESPRSRAMFGAMAERHFTHAEDVGADSFL